MRRPATTIAIGPDVCILFANRRLFFLHFGGATEPA
jgi:hypothetical protein